MLLPYTSPREIDYLARLIADPLTPTCRRWVRRYWATQIRGQWRQEAVLRWPRCMRAMLLASKATTERRLTAAGEGR